MSRECVAQTINNLGGWRVLEEDRGAEPLPHRTTG